MRDIAAELGLCRHAVSSVLNNRAKERGYAPETEKRVREYLAQRGYVPSRHAMRLRKSTRETVGILHCGKLFSHLTEAFNRLTARLMTGPVGVEIMVVPHERRLWGLQELIARGVTRLVWMHTTPPCHELADAAPLFPYLAQFETVVIYNYHFAGQTLDQCLKSLGAHFVGVDRDAAYRRLGKYLRELGHTTVALPEHVPDEVHNSQDTTAAVLRVAGLAVMGCRAGFIYECTPKFAIQLAGVLHELCRTRGVTAACFGDDVIAGYAMTELLRRGVQIPRDLTVTGFDGMPFAGAFSVPLTTLAMPVEKMTDCALQLLCAKTSRRRHCFPMELVLRASHGPAPVKKDGK